MHSENIEFGLPTHWDEETDVVIIGSGFAGLSAAAEACNAGAKVTILEKMGHYGGNSIISGGGICSYDSKMKLREKLGLGEDSWQLHMQDTVTSGDNLSLPELVEVMTQKAPEVINFFIDAGATFADILQHIAGHSTHRNYHATKGGKMLAGSLCDLALSKGAELRLKTALTRIWRADAASPVSGLCFESDGTKKNLRVRRALIMASGGFARDLEMLRQYNPLLTDGYNSSNHPGATGECIRFAQAVGAGVIHMDHIQLFPAANPDSGLLDKYALNAYAGTGFGAINVNRSGRRFVNEFSGRDKVSDAQINSGEKLSYTILTKDIFDALGTSQSAIDKGVSSGRIIAAETPADLAEKIGTRYLPQTIEAHNCFISEGKDAQFNKIMNSQMIPMLHGPYYAIPQWPSIHFCMGGLRFDSKARVLDKKSVPIARFYAAGECCGGVHGANRLAGNAIAECIVFGRIAGANAAVEPPVKD